MDFTTSYNILHHYPTERVSCPDGWAPHRSSCYIYKEQSTSWDNAKANCEEYGNGAHLTHIGREEENNFTSFDLLKVLTDRSHSIWWTGLRRIQVMAIEKVMSYK